MKYEEKIKCLEHFLIENGEKKRMGTPPLFRLLWKLGWKLPPPLFQSFKINVLVFGSFSVVLFGAFEYFAFLKNNEDNNFGYSVIVIILAGVCLGTLWAWFFSSKRHKLKLPDWNQFPITASDKNSQNQSSEPILKTPIE